MASYVRNNTEIKGQLFSSVNEIEEFSDIPTLVKKYNDNLWFGHKEESKLVIEHGQIFINGYKNDTCYILTKLKEYSTEGIHNYSQTVTAWLSNPNNGVDCEDKKTALIKMFENSKVSLIYGSAGTGKSTLINHVAHFWAVKRNYS